MDKLHTYQDIGKRKARARAAHGEMDKELQGRAAAYRKYAQMLRAIASGLRVRRTRVKLLLVADEFHQKAALMDAIGGPCRVANSRRNVSGIS